MLFSKSVNSWRRQLGIPLLLVLSAITLHFPLADVFGQTNSQDSTKTRRETSARPSARTGAKQVLIKPGVSVGPLVLGETWKRTLELFPSKPEDQKWEDACGITFNWSDRTNDVGSGNVFVRLKNEKVFQIESATTRFHTVEGLRIYDPPEKVRRYYKDLRAFVLLSDPIRALGDRPLIFWVNTKRGLAFAFAYDLEQQSRYLYKIIVFRPNTNLCPEEETTRSPNWQELAPYSLEPPDRITNKSLRQAGDPA